MASVLQKTQTVLEKVNVFQDPNPHFVQDDAESRNHRLIMDVSVWEEMGSPETITVTIEPGDTLND